MPDVESKWNQNIDKISYAAAGVLGLIVLCVPFLLSAPVRTGDLSNALNDLEGQIQANKPKYPQTTAEDIAGISKTQWTPGAALGADPAWRTERDPVLVRLVQSVAGEDCKHLPGQITELAAVRDPKRKAVNLVVKGTPSPDNTAVVIKKMELLRKEGEGEYKPLSAFKATGEFTFADETVEPGKKYTYKLITTAARDPKAPEHYKFEKTPVTQESNELGSGDHEVPPDFSLAVLGFDPADPTKFFGKESHWDYKTGKAVVGNSGNFKESDLIGGRFEVFRVDSASGDVIIRDKEKGGAKYTFSSKGSKVLKSIACWDPVTPGGGEEAPKEDAEPPAKDKAAAKPAAKPAEKAPEKKPEKKTETKPASKTTKSGAKKLK